MRTVHETEALRPSDPVPKHHSSNPTNKSQRLRLVLNNERAQKDKGSTPASPSSHAPASATAPSSAAADAEYAHNNIIYMQDLDSPGAPTMVQFPPDMNFTERELSLPPKELFRLLRRQLHWATQEGEELRATADALEKRRKEEWVAKELLFENYTEAQLATHKRKHLETGVPEGPDVLALLEEDVVPSKKLKIEPKAGKMPWWREQSWLEKLADVRLKESVTEGGVPPPSEGHQQHALPEEHEAAKVEIQEA
jgi:hypothetical protein